MTQDKYTPAQVIEALKVFNSRNQVRPPEDTKFEPYQMLDVPIKHLEELEKENRELKEKIKKYERWMVGGIKQLGDPAFLLTYQSGSQLIKEIRQSMLKLLYE